MIAKPLKQRLYLTSRLLRIGYSRDKIIEADCLNIIEGWTDIGQMECSKEIIS